MLFRHAGQAVGPAEEAYVQSLDDAGFPLVSSRWSMLPASRAGMRQNGLPCRSNGSNSYRASRRITVTDERVT
jgi:hypothetical protein